MCWGRNCWKTREQKILSARGLGVKDRVGLVSEMPWRLSGWRPLVKASSSTLKQGGNHMLGGGGGSVREGRSEEHTSEPQSR